MSLVPSPMYVTYIGNFEPPHSTENHIKRALVHNGHHVVAVQENRIGSFDQVARSMETEAPPDLVLWTRTGWDWNSIYRQSDGEQQALQGQRYMQAMARRANIPVVGYHLDIWFGLARQHLVDTEPFFSSDLVITADGGHQAEFAGKGVNHVWFPPGVSLAECEVGTLRRNFTSRIAFVGSHDGGYHPEHEHRHKLIAWLKKNHRRDCTFFPLPGQPSVRGRHLQDLYASVDVVIGDSCFAGTGLANYWSDRIPETLGRGGFLLHPEVPGLAEHFDPIDHLWTWKAGDWDRLGELIATTLGEPTMRHEIAAAGMHHVREHHTYERRMEQLVDLLHERKLLK